MINRVRKFKSTRWLCPKCKQTVIGRKIEYLEHQKMHLDGKVEVKNNPQKIIAKPLKKRGERRRDQIKALERENKRLLDALNKKQLIVQKKEKIIKKVSFYDSDSWRSVRMPVLRDHIQKYGRYCLLCGCGGELHVDHIIPRSIRPDLELDPKNLQVLCRACNLGKSNKDQTDFRTI